jgi:hypothetical protein
MKHILLERARSYEWREMEIAPPGCTYDPAVGAWVLDGTSELVVSSPDRIRPPQTKKNDVETGEDQKGH